MHLCTHALSCSSIGSRPRGLAARQQLPGLLLVTARTDHPRRSLRPGYCRVLPEEDTIRDTGAGMNLQIVGQGSAAGVVLLGVGTIIWLSSHGYTVEGIAQAVTTAVSESGSAGPVLFIAAYVAAAVLFVPGSLLTLAAGYLYGPFLGTCLVSIASTSGATLAFLICRYGARPFVEKLLEGYPKFRAMDAAVAKEGARIVFLLRLSPLFPFTLLNYALGLTSVELLPYVSASWAGMLPGTFAYVYLGGVGKAAVEAAGPGTDYIKLALYGVGAVATLLATKYISSAAADALRTAEGSDNAE